MKLVLDVMGGDHAPVETVAGAVDYARDSGYAIILVGMQDVVEAELAKYDTSGLDLSIVHASENLDIDEKPALAARRKKDNSMAVGMRLVKEGEGDGFCTVGHTGGALTAGHMVFRRIPGVQRAVLTTPFPGKKGLFILGDIGANSDCKSEWLAQWGQMMAIYAEARLGLDTAGVALLSNGEEEGKGNDLTRGAEPLLQSLLGKRYIGAFEPKEMVAGEADVIVTDGFTGNVVIKLAEAVAGHLMDVIKEEIMARPVSKVGAAIARPAFRAAAERLDDREYGAGLLLGLNGLVTVGHGRSKRGRIYFALHNTAQLVETGVIDKVRAEVATTVKRT